VGRDDRAEQSDLLDAMKRAAEVLRDAGIPFALCGGLAAFARGGVTTDHDVDFLILEDDADRALAALDAAGFRTEHPPEDWLVKAYHGEVLIDLIHRPVDRPVTAEILADVDDLSLAAVMVPVLSGTELLIHSLLRLTAQECDLAPSLLQARAIREQIDFDRVRDQTKGSPYAKAFLFLAEELEIIGSEGIGSGGAAHGR
jgi:hypothetical protein